MKDEHDTQTADAFSVESILGESWQTSGGLIVSQRHALVGHYRAVPAPKAFAVTGKRHAGTTTPDAFRDAWQTPRWLFNYFNMIAGGFDVDAAAGPVNALCKEFYSEDMDALSFDWPAGKKYWLNPPYSKIEPWVKHAVVQGERKGSSVHMLVPDDVSTLWFKMALDNAAEAYILTHDGVEGSAGRSGRVQFINAMTGEKGKGNNKGSWVFVFRRHRVPVKIIPIDRTLCEAEAQSFF